MHVYLLRSFGGWHRLTVHTVGVCERFSPFFNLCTRDTVSPRRPVSLARKCHLKPVLEPSRARHSCAMPIIPDAHAIDPSIYVKLRKLRSLPGMLEASAELAAMMSCILASPRSRARPPLTRANASLGIPAELLRCAGHRPLRSDLKLETLPPPPAESRPSISNREEKLRL